MKKHAEKTNKGRERRTREENADKTFRIKRASLWRRRRLAGILRTLVEETVAREHEQKTSKRAERNNKESDIKEVEKQINTQEMKYVYTLRIKQDKD